MNGSAIVSGVLTVVSGGLDGGLNDWMITVTLNFTSTSMSSLRLISSVASKRHLKLSPLSWRAYATPATFKPQEKDPQLADYPNLPWVSNQELPARGWWDQQMRRNFGDPIHEYDEVLSMWGPDTPPIPPHKALFQLSLAISAFVGFGFLCKYILVPERPTVPREYPYSGLVRELGGLEENKAREETEEIDE